MDFEVSGQKCIHATKYQQMVTCPRGTQRRSDDELAISCQKLGRDCPPGSARCFCKPCASICTDSETYTIDGTCRCKRSHLRMGGVCVESKLFWMLLVLVVAGIILLVLGVRRCFSKDGSDSLWVIKPEELRFDSTPVCGMSSMIHQCSSTGRRG